MSLFLPAAMRGNSSAWEVWLRSWRIACFSAARVLDFRIGPNVQLPFQFSAWRVDGRQLNRWAGRTNDGDPRNQMSETREIVWRLLNTVGGGAPVFDHFLGVESGNVSPPFSDSPIYDHHQEDDPERDAYWKLVDNVLESGRSFTTKAMRQAIGILHQDRWESIAGLMLGVDVSRSLFGLERKQWRETFRRQILLIVKDHPEYDRLGRLRNQK